jgi:molecular chaperone GrpE
VQTVNDETTQTPAAPSHTPATGADPAGSQASPASASAAPEAAAAPDQATAQVGDGDGSTAMVEETELVVGEVLAEAPAETVAEAAAPAALGAELAALRSELDERTGDLQRLTAEYANYRRRVERDRALGAELATAQVVGALLPVLDDLDRAREHGDLVGPAATMADQLGAALAKFGLTGFGEVGDAFDPTRHEAVTHQTSAEVTAPTCVGVMRRGYQLGERVLRPALVAVADPASE